MKTKLLLAATLILPLLASQGCASTASKALDQKMENEKTVKSRRDLQIEADNMINSDPSLTAEQKAKLIQLRQTVSADQTKFNQQSLKLRAVLMDDMASPTYDLNEVDLIKSRMKKVEDNRQTALFEALDKASEILGHSQNRRVMGLFLMGHPHEFRD